MKGAKEEMSDSGRILTCVYCGQQYLQDTPAWGDKILTDHIKICEKNPFRRAKADIAKLRKALVELVGSDDPEELKQMEATLRVIAPQGKDKEASINAINALLETGEYRD